MDYKRIEKRVRSLYDKEYALGYKKSDESVVISDAFSYYEHLLKSACRKFGPNIDVLDVGCGTGRYFSCLESVNRLTGIDVSAHMIEEARNPIGAEKICTDKILLIWGNVFDMEFKNESFDFIYSIGVLAEHAPFDLYICNKFFDWLRVGGGLLFTTVNLSSKRMSLKRRVVEKLYPMLPKRAQEMLDNRRKGFAITSDQLKSIMNQSRFMRYLIFKIRDNVHTHDICIAQK